MNDIPPLLPADQMPPIRNERDLHQHWRALMGELGFSARTLWVTFVQSDGTMFPHIVQIADSPEYPAERDLDGLMSLCVRTLEVVGDDVTFAMLLSRPGSSVVTDSDRDWAARISAAAGDRSIGMYPMHLATDQSVRVLAPDDLIGAA